MKIFIDQYFSFIVIVIVINIVSGDGVRVWVEQGWLEGELLDLVTKDGTYNSFKGIPYAQPPIGTLRFKAPQPPLPWTGVLNATQHGSMCPQRDIITNVLIPGNENCLFINVYSTDLKPLDLMPVVVFVHGGGFKSGSGNVDHYSPDFLLRKNMVVVTFNYRLDALGFLSLGTEDVPGNAGMKDQVAALKWVQKNIKYFGGDANKVTLMGQSAGSASVALHIISPMSRGLFHRAIALSGSPYNDWALSFHPERRAFVLGKDLGFETEDPQQLLEFLQSVSKDKLVDTSPNILSFENYTSNTLKMSPFVPVIETCYGNNSFLANNIFKDFTHINKADILFGHTDQEAVTLIETITSTFIERYNKYPEFFVPQKVLNEFQPTPILKLSDRIYKHYFGKKRIDLNSTKEFINYATYSTITYDAINFFVRLPIVENTVRFMYKFSMVSSRNVYGEKGIPYGINGAAHLDDLAYLFDPKTFNLTLDAVEFSLIDQVTTIFADFAKTGNPMDSSAFNVTWPLFNNRTKQYMNLGNNGSQVITTVSSVDEEDELNFWEEFYASIGYYP
ncbi:hypothetical protein B5X24_HaOG200167 [Helicoverpa armigera]|nr:hypothetical protein B5X24_HaOG200167 [Helicoverpa armigera]